jgi:branched-chain amino acid transport system substrate-binding protein
MDKRFWAAGALSLLAVQVAAADEIKVGLLLPYSGVYAALGEEIEAGFRMAVEGANDTGHTFTIVKEDSEAKPPVGLAKARKLVLEDEVDVLSGIVSSGVLAAVRDFVDSSQVPLIVSNAGADESTGKSCSKYITRVSFSNSQVNRPMGKWMFDQGVRRVYTLAPDYAAGHEQINAFKTEFEKAGGEIVGGEFTPFQKTQDFGPYLTTAKAAGPDAIYVFYAGGEAISFVKQYDSFGLKGDIGLYGSGFLNSQLYLAAEGEAAVGTVGSLHYVPTLETEDNKAFVEEFKAKTGRLPSEYGVQGYDAGRALIEAVKAGATDRASLAEALPKISYTGPRGPLQIDPATNNVVQNVYIYEIVKGDDGALTQKVLATVENVKDEPNGCQL